MARMRDRRLQVVRRHIRNRYVHGIHPARAMSANSASVRSSQSRTATRSKSEISIGRLPDGTIPSRLAEQAAGLFDRHGNVLVQGRHPQLDGAAIQRGLVLMREVDRGMDAAGQPASESVAADAQDGLGAGDL